MTRQAATPDPDVATTERVFISGPMTGVPDWNHPLMHEVAAAWRALGHEVVNPAELFDGRTDLPREEYVRACLAELLRCTLLVQLPGWRASEGAQLEHKVAKAIGLRIVAHG